MTHPSDKIIDDDVKINNALADKYFSSLATAVVNAQNAHRVAHPDSKLHQFEQNAQTIKDILHHTAELVDYLARDANAYHSFSRFQINGNDMRETISGLIGDMDAQLNDLGDA